jgi:SAM-dependent methyltransferase
MKDNRVETVRENYDRLAKVYADKVFDELQYKPIDRDVLKRFAERTRDQGEVCDLGCGPGHVAQYLRNADTAVFGVDLSPRMVEQARRLNPQISFRIGNMLSLDIPSDTLAGITAFYSIVNISREFLPLAFREMARVLKPGGLLLIAFHVGDDVVSVNELWGEPITMNTFRFTTAEIIQGLEKEHLVVSEVVEREPYLEVEYQSPRAYVFAEKRIGSLGL